MRKLFALVDALACLAQDNCDEMLPDYVRCELFAYGYTLLLGASYPTPRPPLRGFPVFSLLLL